MDETARLHYDDFLGLSLDELKFYLRQRGHIVSGSKKDLAARALICFESGETPKDFVLLEKEAKQEYEALLQSFSMTDPLKEKSWIDDIKQWPPVDLGKIFQYILDSKAFEADYVGQYKVKKAFSYFNSGFVSQIVLQNLSMNSETRIVLKSSVLPSQKVSSASHSVWVLLKKSGEVMTAYCSCTAGLSRCCNHVIAVLYKIEYAVASGITSPSCTEVKCGFNDRSKKVIKGCKIMSMNIEKHAVGLTPKKQSLNSHMKKSFDPRNHAREINQDSFFERLNEIKPTAGILLCIPKKEDDQCPPCLPEIAETMANDVNTLRYESVVQNFMEKLTFSTAQLEELEKLSRSQSLSKIWFSQRVGRLTSSNHHDVKTKIDSILRQKKNVVLTPLLATILGCGPCQNALPSIRWGRANEDKAANVFFKQIVKAHESPRLHSSGLFVYPQMPFIAASPDRILSCKCCPRYGVEIKCPYTLRNRSFEDAWKDLGFIKEVEGKRQLKRNHKYYAQVQGQMGCAGYEKSFFVG